MNEAYAILVLLVFKLTLEFSNFSSIAPVLADDYHYLNLKRGPLKEIIRMRSLNF